ncbi:hypothetical protein [Thermococcus sp.]
MRAVSGHTFPMTKIDEVYEYVSHEGRFLEVNHESLALLKYLNKNRAEFRVCTFPPALSSERAVVVRA